jgi:adenosine/AMP kinase
MNLNFVQIDLPENSNVIFGQSHFIKTVEDVSEILIGAVPGIEFGLAFCEASDPCLIRTEGNSDELVKAAAANAEKVAAGHSFILFIRNAFPINVLKQIQSCQEIVTIFAATANPLQVIVAETEQGRGVAGVVDGFSPKGIESDKDKEERKALLRKFSYKF